MSRITTGKLHGGGVSSSAAAGVAFLLALEDANGLRVSPEENIRLDQATSTAAKKLFDDARDILGYDLIEVCRQGPAEKLNSTVVSQPAIFVASLAALESLRIKEPGAAADCVATAGLSLGEYTALVFAEALSFADGLRLVQKRGQAMREVAVIEDGALRVRDGRITEEQLDIALDVDRMARPHADEESADTPDGS